MEKSRSKRILNEMLRDGTVPLQQYDEDGNITMSIEDILLLHEDFILYDPKKFQGRLDALRKNILNLNERAAEDLEAFKIFTKNYEAVEHNSHGVIQWQKSDAQELIWDDIKAGKLETMTKQELWMHRDEYRLQFPLAVFRKKIEQEIRTAKYVKTLEEKGVVHPSS